MKHSERLAPLAAAVSAVATLACCLPLGIAGGLAALGLGAALTALRPWLLGLAVILLGVGGYQLFHGPRTCRKRSRLTLALFGISAVVVVAIAAFPQVVAGWMADLP